MADVGAATGARRALLVGSATFGLTGCNGDVTLMRDVLTARGFDSIDARVDGDASRAGIVDGIEALIAAIRPGDAAVVYFSGHGGRVVRPDFEARRAAGLSVHFQFIVPSDLDQSDVGDFRGITAEELTGYQRRLTDAFRAAGAVPNVVTILDCCHSGYMARDAAARPKAVDVETEVFDGSKAFRLRGIREHLTRLGTAADLAGIVTNPDAVRLVACQPEQSAYEMRAARGGQHGALTDALASVLEQVGDAELTWGVVGDLVRRRVAGIKPEQRPDVEGPSSRLLFSTASAPSSDVLPVTVREGRAAVEAAALLGIAVGDEFRIIAAATGATIAPARVGALDGGAAVLDLAPDVAAAVLAGAALAVPVRISVPKLAIALDGDTGPLADELATSRRLAVAGPGDAVIAKVGPGRAPGTLAVADATGAPWRTTEPPADAAGCRRVADLLDEIAIGQRLLGLASGRDAGTLDAPIVIDFVRLGPAAPEALARHGARLDAGDRVQVSVRNPGPDPLYAWIFDVGVSGRSTALSRDASSGLLLGPAGREDDRFDLWGETGEVLYWPEAVPVGPARAERPETFVVIVATSRADLSDLSSPAISRGTRSPLEAVLEEARTGVREARPAGTAAASLRYRLDTIEFFLRPPP